MSKGNERETAAAVALPPARVVSGALDFGTAFHTLLLEPEKFGEEYEMLPELNLRTKGGREALAELLAASPGKLFLTAEDYKKLMAMSAGALEHPMVFELLGSGGLAEVSFYGTRDGEETKVRVDLVLGLEEEGAPLVLADLKTTRDASPEAFLEAVERFNYDAQEAWYVQEVEKITQRHVADFLFIVCEKQWPYHAGVYRLNTELKRKGAWKVERAWERYLRCVAVGHWPHYGDDGVLEI